MNSYLIKYTVFCLLFALLSCHNNKEFTRFESIIKEAMNADSVSISSSGDTALLNVLYKEVPALEGDYLSSIIALTYLDTAKQILSKDKFQQIKVSIAYSQGVEVYSYPINILEKAKIGMEYSAEFIQNMLNGTAENIEPLIDASKIDKSAYPQINHYGMQIRKMGIEQITYDGFISHASQPNDIMIRARLLSKSEAISVTFHYNIQRKKLFYFGINE